MTDLVLIVDDDPIQRRLLEALVARMGLEPFACDGGRSALRALEEKEARPVGAVVLDLLMPDQGGMEVLARMRRAGSPVPVVVQTAKGGVDVAVEAMRAGAFDFLVKPASPKRMETAIRNAVRFGRSEARRSRPLSRGRAASLEPGPDAGSAMRVVLRQAAKAAVSGIPVLIEGETGVGKEWLAEAIRRAGARARRPFVAVNCGALPGPLAESILFGHEKGAFTDADKARLGKFLEADGGTIFLDEVGELAPEVQVKLLRVLQTGEIARLGGQAPLRADVRIISATNRDLLKEVREGRFREDLYYRLAAFPVRVPPLRERRGEIAGLLAGFVRRFAAEEGRPHLEQAAPAALRLLEAYDWPGNIRELQNAVHRAVVLCEGEWLEEADFPQIRALLGALGDPAERPSSGPQEAGRRESGAPAPAGEMVFLLDEKGHVRTLEAVEEELIRSAIRRYEGRMSEVARRLGIGRSTLYRKLREYRWAEN